MSFVTAYDRTKCDQVINKIIDSFHLLRLADVYFAANSGIKLNEFCTCSAMNLWNDCVSINDIKIARKLYEVSISY